MPPCLVDTVWLLRPLLVRERTIWEGMVLGQGRKAENTIEEFTADGTLKHDYLGKGNMHSSSYNHGFMKLKISLKCGFGW